ncbi:hypothetical protein ACN2XU_10865 [Primorskyibacter sp. 2E107]|uniref:hypothetical protein n=1 Tax=Primorskyibacter sp. 2E107 TaxID=3403458 RepID=UPI003AF94926
MLRLLSLLAALTFSGLATQTSAATAVTNGSGALIGATGVEYNGKFYDVSLESGSCIDVFGSCAVGDTFLSFDDVTSYQFVGDFITQVIAGTVFDADPFLISGCSSTSCSYFLPYRVSDQGKGNFAVDASRWNIRAPAVSSDSASYGRYAGTPSSTNLYMVASYASTAEVPLPASLPLLAGGLGLIAALRRRRRKA